MPLLGFFSVSDFGGGGYARSRASAIRLSCTAMRC